MASLNMRRRANRVSYFVTVQLVALIGWIIVQSLFNLLATSGHVIPFLVIMIIETIWWIATLVIMFFLFRRVYNGFVQNVLELEEANKKLRDRTNSFLMEQVEKGVQKEN
jgi:hypothetical protein